MNSLGGMTVKRALLGLAAIIVVGGIALALVSNSPLGVAGVKVPAGPGDLAFHSLNSAISVSSGSTSVIGPGNTLVVSQVTTTAGGIPPTGVVPPGKVEGIVNKGSPPGSGGLIEFSSELSLSSPSPQQTASSVAALAYTVGGYVAYQSTYSTSATLVIRVPAAVYQDTLAKIEAMGKVTVLTSTSNDVRVQYTDLNATLASLKTEQAALLRLLNQSSSVNATLAIESQLQQVNQQINSVQSQILQTKLLIDYATIDVNISEAAQQVPLAISLSATPTNGTAPLSVTFNAILKGGQRPYYVNYNFGDGFASQGQIVIHTYFEVGTYRVVASATDQNGTVVQATTTVKVDAPHARSGIESFFSNVTALFFSVIEGIVEVAVVVLPIAAVGAAIIIPVQRRGRSQKAVKQAQ
jgi:hypothetical protein